MSEKKFSPNSWFQDSTGRIVHDVTIRVGTRTQRLTITTTAVLLPVAALQNRQFIKIQNVGGATVYLGGPDVTTSNGWNVLPFATETFSIEDIGEMYAISAGSVDIIIMEGL